MYEEIAHFFAYYSKNTPLPPPKPVTNDKKILAKHAVEVKRFKSQKDAVVANIVEYKKLLVDLLSVQKALKSRADLLAEQKSKTSDTTLIRGIEIIVNEFTEYFQQCLNPDRKKGRNIMMSFGPMTLLRAGIQGSPTEIPAQCLSLLLATITFANNYFCDSNLATVDSTYTSESFQEGCPKALVDWVFVSLVALKAFKSMAGPTAIAVFLSLVNSIITITTMMDKQTAELIKRIGERGEDLIVHTTVGDAPPPPACTDSCFPQKRIISEENTVVLVALAPAAAAGSEDEVEVVEVVAADGNSYLVDATGDVLSEEGEVIGKFNSKTKKVKMIKSSRPATKKEPEPTTAAVVPVGVMSIQGLIDAPVSLLQTVLFCQQKEEPTNVGSAFDDIPMPTDDIEEGKPTVSTPPPPPSPAKKKSTGTKRQPGPTNRPPPS